MPVDDSPGDFESALKPLWLRAQSGDDAAYRQALGLLASRLRAYFKRRLSGLPDEVEDLVQETLLALHLQRGTHDPTLPVSAWAVAIVLTKLEGLSVAEAATRTGASESAIKVQVHRGLKRLGALVRGEPKGDGAGDVGEQPRPHDPGMSRPGG